MHFVTLSHEIPHSIVHFHQFFQANKNAYRPKTGSMLEYSLDFMHIQCILLLFLHAVCSLSVSRQETCTFSVSRICALFLRKALTLYHISYCYASFFKKSPFLSHWRPLHLTRIFHSPLGSQSVHQIQHE